MAVFWKCDICGKETHVAPPTEPVFVDEEKKVPKIVHVRHQHTDGTIHLRPTQAVKDLAPRTKIVRLTVGDETIQRDVCDQCLGHLRPQFDALWSRMVEVFRK